MLAMKKGLTKRQTIFLHTLKSSNHMTESEYRELLREGAGVSSSKELDQVGFDQVLDLMEMVGFDVGARRRNNNKHSHRKGMATPKQLSYIEDLMGKVFGEERGTFEHWLEYYYKVSHINFLTVQAARGAIEALKSMVGRGYQVEGKKDGI